MPNHSGPKINGILESFKEERKTCVQNIITPMRVIFEKLLHAGFLQSRERGAIKRELNSGYCSYHAEVRGHDIQECSEFWEVVQNLMDKKKIEFSDSKNPSINVITGTTYSGTPSSTGPRPITIFQDNEVARTGLPKVPIPVLVVEVPKPFPYESQKAIPWDYYCNYTHQTTVNDLTSVGGLT